jgi:hypothetical protein
MKVGIIGSREFSDYDKMKESILSYFRNKNLDINTIEYIVSGGARGADKLGERFAEEFNIKTKIHLPNWDKFGKSAGMIRNSDIIDDSDLIFAFWDGQSKGTKDSINKARKRNKEIEIIIYA